MTTIDVTPVGIQLYAVDIRDDDGESRHEIGIPDELIERMDLEGLAMQDVVLAATEFLLSREDREQLPAEIDLGAMADRYEELAEQVPAQARSRATTQTPPPGLRTDERGTPSGDDRLIAEVEEEQRTGRASKPDPLR